MWGPHLLKESHWPDTDLVPILHTTLKIQNNSLSSGNENKWVFKQMHQFTEHINWPQCSTSAVQNFQQWCKCSPPAPSCMLATGHMCEPLSKAILLKSDLPCKAKWVRKKKLWTIWCQWYVGYKLTQTIVRWPRREEGQGVGKGKGPNVWWQKMMRFWVEGTQCNVQINYHRMCIWNLYNLMNECQPNKCNFIYIYWLTYMTNLHLNGHMWLVATVLDSTAIDPGLLQFGKQRSLGLHEPPGMSHKTCWVYIFFPRKNTLRFHQILKKSLWASVVDKHRKPQTPNIQTLWRGSNPGTWSKWPL